MRVILFYTLAGQPSTVPTAYWHGTPAKSPKRGQYHFYYWSVPQQRHRSRSESSVCPEKSWIPRRLWFWHSKVCFYIYVLQKLKFCQRMYTMEKPTLLMQIREGELIYYISTIIPSNICVFFSCFIYHVSCTDGKISVRINLIFYLFFQRCPIQHLCVSFLGRWWKIR